MSIRVLKKITRRIRKAWADTAPPSSAPPAYNPFCTLVGRLNLRNSATLRTSLWKLLWRHGRTIGIDCSQIRFMDGSALAVLIEFAYQCRDRGINLRLVDPSHQMCNAFSLYGLADALVEICEFQEIELDGVVVLTDEEFPDSIRLPALMVEDEEFADSIRLPALSKARIEEKQNPWKDAA